MPKPRGVLHVPLVPIPEDTLDDAVDAELRNGAGPSGYGLEAEEDYVRERRGPWATFFQRGSDVESARVNHHYTREERGRLNAVEGVDYFSPNSEVYREWLRSQPHRRTWDRWLMMGTIGAFTGFVGYCLYLAINYVSMAKHQIFWRFTAGLSWFLNTSMSVGLAFCAAWTVVFVAPAAAGSGVPEVMAFLNGLNIPKVFNIRTFLVKLVSTCLAVSSGLPVGPEGPMIHIGAAIGAGLSQTHSTTLGLDLEVFERFRNPKDKRDFVTAGAAVGAAVAFEAPIGGLLFAFEEVASFWQQSLCWQIFFACVCSILSLGLLRSAEKALGGEGHFGLFESTTLFEVKNSLLKTHIVMVIPAVVIGVICGLVGIVFTVMNLKVSRLRDELMKERKWWRVWEPCILAFIFVTGTVVLPMFFPCVEAHCFINEQDDLQHTCIPEDSDDLSRVIEPVSRLETCIPGGHLSAKQANSYWEQKAKSEGTYVNGSYPVEYNELATLMSLTGEDGIRSLLTRGTHREFSYQALLTMLVWYGVGAALAAGSSISSGLFIPMMMIGALIGRLVGLMTTALVAASTGIINGVFSEDSQFAAIDPGVFAFIGAAAFMGGVTRLTVSLAVIMIEISNDVHMLPPILVAVMIAKWVADSWTHSLYHGLLEVKCVPFLPPQPISKDSLDLMETRAVMHSPVVTMREQMRVAEIKEVLRETSHNGFPIIQDSPHGGVFGGLITRHHLLVLLRALRSRGSTGHLSVSYDELKRRNVTAKARREVSEQQRALQIGNNGDHSEGDSSDELLDLGMYINRSAMKVQESFSVERTYILFRTMGLRHLVVVDEHNHVKGIVTRKDLLGFRLDDAATREEIRGSGDWDL